MTETPLYSLVNEMHARFGFHDVVEKMDENTFWEFIKFRVGTQIQEEVNELLEAIDERNPEEVLDALIDIDVFQKGTVDFVVSYEAYLEGYTRVMNANLAKKTGVKPGRPNPWGFPDLIKPEGWTAPTHEGLFDEIALRMTEPAPKKFYVEVPEHLQDRAKEIIADLIALEKTANDDGHQEWKPNITQIRLLRTPEPAE